MKFSALDQSQFLGQGFENIYMKTFQKELNVKILGERILIYELCGRKLGNEKYKN